MRKVFGRNIFRKTFQLANCMFCSEAGMSNFKQQIEIDFAIEKKEFLIPVLNLCGGVFNI